MDDWRALVADARGGDLTAFEAVVRRFMDMAVGYAYSILGDFPLAEDAAQEAFVQAYHDLAMLREPQAFPSWLRRIVFKYCDRHSRRKRLPTVPLEATMDVADPQPDPQDTVERRELQPAAACFGEEHDLMWRIWGLAGGYHCPKAYLNLATPEVRRAIAPVILEARDRDVEAAAHIERALRR